EAFEIQSAMTFLALAYEQSGKNPKPVVFHSMRVGLHLLELGYETPIVVSGILHDLIEDTDVSYAELEQKFGREVATCVSAVSFDARICDPVEQYREMFHRTVTRGRAAVAVKAIDLYSNSFYFGLVHAPSEQERLANQLKFFLRAASAYANEAAYRVLA